MKRRLLWITVLGIALVVLGAVAFFALFEEVPVTRQEAAQAEAQRNPYLALERFMQRMQRPLTRDNDATLLDRLPAGGGVLILDINRRVHLTPERLARLLAWVEAGGYVIAAPEWQGEDRLLAHFGLVRPERKEPAAVVDEDDEAEAEAPAPPPKAKAVKPSRRAPETVNVTVPGSPRALTIEFRRFNFTTGQRQPEWAVSSTDFGPNVLHFKHGRGAVTVLPLSHFTNTMIGRHDAAELMWTLVQTYQPQGKGPLILMTRLHLPTLWEWLAGPAQAALIAGLLLLALWLWRIIPRFGPLAPEPEPHRRQLREHLTAVGRYVWRAGGLAHWLQIAREAFFTRLKVRQPSLAQLPPDRLPAALSQLTQRPATLIASTLYGRADSMHDFTIAMRTLRNLERSI